jgi:hypothetical protein
MMRCLEDVLGSAGPIKDSTVRRSLAQLRRTEAPSVERTPSVFEVGAGSGLAKVSSTPCRTVRRGEGPKARP